MNLYFDNDDHEDDESSPLTPRDSTSTGSSSSVRRRRQHQSPYLNYFRSPAKLDRLSEDDDDDLELGVSSASDRVYSPHSFLSLHSPHHSVLADDPDYQRAHFRVSQPYSTRSASTAFSAFSDATHLLGEKYATETHHEDLRLTLGRMETPYSRDTRFFSYADEEWPHQRLKKDIQLFWRQCRERLGRSYKEENLKSLSYLINEHKRKAPVMQGENEHFDFVLVLQPQQSYAYWAELLDFRAEYLGQENLQVLEENWESLLRDPSLAFTSSSTHSSPRYSSDSCTEGADSKGSPKQFSSPSVKSSISLNRSSSSLDSEELDTIDDAITATPNTGLYSRRMRHAHQVGTPLNPCSGAPSTPGPGSVISTYSRWSLFERAAGTSAHSPAPYTRISSMSLTSTPGTSNLRRWGQRHATDTILSPKNCESPASSSMNINRTVKSSKGPHEITFGTIPTQTLPRGIAVRSCGLKAFLIALEKRSGKNGIIVRRHRPGSEAVHCRLYTTNGGDTICYEHVTAASVVENGQGTAKAQDDEDNVILPEAIQNAKKGFPKQFSKVRTFGTIRAADLIWVQPASEMNKYFQGNYGTSTIRKSKSEYDPFLTFTVVTRRMTRTDLADHETKLLQGTALESDYKYFDIEASNAADYWKLLQGFVRLRKDAIVQRFAKQRATGTECHYNRIALEEEMNRRNHMANELYDDEANNPYKYFESLDRLGLPHSDEFHEPATVGWMERLYVKWRKLDPTYMQGHVLPSAVSPPSDYFLGFKTPGTAIWARLRWAGLETQRVYSLDPRRVMIKIRCPTDRLIEVAEVWKIKMKTRDGSLAPFNRDMIELFDCPDDEHDAPPLLENSTLRFRSNLRQTIIDFMIDSKFIDSGAGLRQNSDLGRMIQVRAPLHVREKLESILSAWLCFWRAEYWCSYHGRRFSLLSDSAISDGLPTASPSVPNILVRFCKGSFYQPLDMIEEYFGEKVCFYFAWLEHTAAHLVVLSVPGFLLFCCQVASNNWDHPLRPYFSMVVMLWTFIVLINWRKRANFLAYKWGTMNYKEQETTRPQFHGKEVHDEITHERILVYPKWKRWMKYMLISFPISLLFTCGTLYMILTVHANRDLQLWHYQTEKSAPASEDYRIKWDWTAIGQEKHFADIQLTKENMRDPTFWIIVVGMPAMLGLCLPLLNFVLMRLSVMLNDFENYKTDSEYRTYLIVKVFSFRFVCYFATLYYYAFVSLGSEQAIISGILRVGSGVLIYTTVAQWWQNFLHVCFPMLIRMIRMQHRRQRLFEELQQLEDDEKETCRLADEGYDLGGLKERFVKQVNKRLLLHQAQDDLWLEIMLPQHDSFPEYINAVVQFTFVSCFSVVMPITPLICLCNYLISMRLDAFKLCRGRRRPLAEKTGGIGVWEHLLHIVAVISILTNCWLMGFTHSQFTWIAEEYGNVVLFGIVVGWEHIMLLIKYVMQTSISPLPKEVRDAIKKEQYEIDQERNESFRRRRAANQEGPEGPRGHHDPIASPENSVDPSKTVHEA